MNDGLDGAGATSAPDAVVAEDAAEPASPAAEDRARAPVRTALAMLWDGARTIALALAFSFAIRVVVVEPFHVPTESMEPTLFAGDFIGASKFSYGWSRVSVSPLPMPMIPGRIFGQLPKRGDLIVFRNWRDGGADYVKRVIGLPGDRVQMQNGVLILNGEAAAMENLGWMDGVDPSGEPVRVNVFTETIPGGCTHLVQHYEYPDGRVEGQDDTYEFLVPDGHLFVLGDNRDASYDSRLPGRVGYVPAEDVIGRAQFVFASFADGFDMGDMSSWLSLRGERTLKPLICA